MRPRGAAETWTGCAVSPREADLPSDPDRLAIGAPSIWAYITARGSADIQWLGSAEPDPRQGRGLLPLSGNGVGERRRIPDHDGHAGLRCEEGQLAGRGRSGAG